MKRKPISMLWPERKNEVEWPLIKWLEYDLKQLNTTVDVGKSPHIDIEGARAAMNAIEALRAQEFDLDAVEWRLVETVEGESAADWLKRCDTDFYERIKAEVERCSFCWDEPHILHRKIVEYLNLHAQRRCLLNMVLREEMTKPIQMIVSEEQYKQHFLGHWPAVTKTCKCGVAWDSVLYGATCAKCGEKRPRDAVIHINVKGAK